MRSMNAMTMRVSKENLDWLKRKQALYNFDSVNTVLTALIAYYKDNVPESYEPRRLL